MFREPSAERSRRMMMRITTELERAAEPNPGPWIAAARSLHARSLITENAALYLVEMFLESITFWAMDNDPEMLRLHDEIDRVKREHGLAEDEDWYLHEGPEEWRLLTEEWDRRDYALRTAALRVLGHDDIADLLERDPDDFDHRTSLGHREFWGERADEDVAPGDAFD